MAGKDSIDVTLAHVDPSIVSCWDMMVKRGEECSLQLKHSKGKVIATLQCTSNTKHSPVRSTSPSSCSTAEKKKKKKGSKKKRLEKLLTYHQRLVEEKGLPPSRLMEEHAASSSPAKISCENKFNCDLCDFASNSQRGLKVHVGKSHKDPEELRTEDHEMSVVLSELSCIREDDVSCVSPSSPVCSAIQDPDVKEKQELELEEETDKNVSPFISALAKVLSLWPEDEDDSPHSSHIHFGPDWCRNLRCFIRKEIANREWDAAGECEECEENKNDCECEEDLRKQET